MNVVLHARVSEENFRVGLEEVGKLPCEVGEAVLVVLVAVARLVREDTEAARERVEIVTVRGLRVVWRVGQAGGLGWSLGWHLPGLSVAGRAERACLRRPSSTVQRWSVASTAPRAADVSWRAVAADAGKQRERLKNVVSELKELIDRATRVRLQEFHMCIHQQR